VRSADRRTHRERGVRTEVVIVVVILVGLDVG
jgi:hypothetical protein